MATPFKRTGTVRCSLPSCSGFEATTFVEFTEMRHRLLNDASANPNAAHQLPHYTPKSKPPNSLI
jgi:hypothetical protein